MILPQSHTATFPLINDSYDFRDKWSLEILGGRCIIATIAMQERAVCCYATKNVCIPVIGIYCLVCSLLNSECRCVNDNPKRGHFAKETTCSILYCTKHSAL